MKIPQQKYILSMIVNLLNILIIQIIMQYIIYYHGIIRKIINIILFNSVLQNNNK